MKLQYRIILILLVVVARSLPATIPAGYYYLAHHTKKEELKTALSQLATPLTVLRYGSGEGFTWQGFFTTDQYNDGSVVDMYSNQLRYFNGYSGVSGMHIEHSLPKSWWGGANNIAYRDLFHLYPSDGKTNSTKSNYPLGVVTSPSFDNGVSKIGPNTFGNAYTGSAFEPADEYKGDFARSYLYIATIYENFDKQWSSPMMDRNTYPVWNKWARELLLQWHANDPVSAKEELRQEAVYAIQGNRNPFIDYPELASYIWGPDTLNVFPFPEETEAFLITPRRGYSLDFDLILRGDTLLKELDIRGLNFTGELNVRLSSRSAQFTVGRNTLSADEVHVGTTLDIVFRPLRSGTFRDTLVISGGGITDPFRVPLVGKASRQLMVLEPAEITPVGATLHWISDPKAENYALQVYQNATKAGNLLFSAYVEGSSYNKAVEIFNGTGATVELSDYALAIQSNGAGDYRAVLPLGGQLPHGESLRVVHQLSTNEQLLSGAGLLTDSVLNFNGNDAVALLHNYLRIDAIGFFDNGPELMWGENKTLHRKSSVTHPSASFNEGEWISLEADDFSPLGNHGMVTSPAETVIVDKVLPAVSSWYILQQLNPESDYFYRVSSVRSDTILSSVNSAHFRTPVPEIPIALDASAVGAGAFVAEWESDLYTNQFELEVYTKQGSKDTTITESFDNVGSSGKPLPEGWTGTASGNYTTTASSGALPPSVGLKNQGEWLQTPLFPDPVSQFGFMYRFPSGAGTSYFKIDALQDDQWIPLDSIKYVNTSKYYPVYYVDKADNLRSFRITYTQKSASANLAIDDITVVYGGKSNVYLFNNRPVTGTSYTVEGLSLQTAYFYRVRSVIGNSRSDWSEEVQVTTLTPAAAEKTTMPSVEWFSTGEGFTLFNITPGSRIQVYSLSGILVKDLKAATSAVSVPLPGKQLFVVRVLSSQQLYSFKIIR